MPQTTYFGLAEHRRILIIGVFLGLLAQWTGANRALGQRIIFVNAAATGADNGTCWENAYRDLQDGLADARTNGGCPCEIWVAAGVYKPDRGTGDRALRFVVPEGVRVFGGFDGTEFFREERDWVAHETVLSGDLNGDDGPLDCADFTDCCREHGTTGCDHPQCEARVCDIQPDCCYPLPLAGYSWDLGCILLAETGCSDLIGKWRRYENSYTVVDVSDSTAATQLNGLSIRGAFISASEVYTTVGGYGMLADRAGATVWNTRFEDNVENGAHGSDAQGISFTACEFHDNHSAPLSFLGGVVYLADSEISGNGQGAGVGRGSFTVTNCHFSPGARSLGSLAGTSGNLIIRNSTFVGHRNWAVGHGDGHAVITDCTFDGNFGGLYLTGSRAVIRNSIFTRNTDLAMSLNASNVLLSNSIVAGNAFDNGYAAIYSSFTNLTIDSCTVVENRSKGYRGGGLIIAGADATVTNSVFWGNGSNWFGNERNGEDGTFYLDDIYGPVTLDINYSIVDGWTGLLGGVGNSGADPMFVDAAGLDGVPDTEDDDLRLSPGSPAINAGDPDYVPISGETDLDGHARVLCGAVDIGAYEFGIGDYNCDQSVDLFDFSGWSACMTGPSTADTAVPQGCEAFDFNADHSIDLYDFYLLSHLFTAP